MKSQVKMVFLALCALTLATQFGCASMNGAGGSSLFSGKLTTEIQLQNSIFVNPEAVDGKPVYVRVRNTTGKSDLGFEEIVVKKLQARGHKITRNPKEAGLRIYANFLYLDEAKDGMTTEGAIVGGVGGAVVGGATTQTYSGAGVGGLIGTGIGALAGSLTSKDRWFGIVDVQLEEPLGKTVKRRTVANSGQSNASGSYSGVKTKTGGNFSSSTSGTSEVSSMDYEEDARHKKLQTRIVGEAKQLNMDPVIAAAELKEKLADAISNFL